VLRAVLVPRLHCEHEGVLRARLVARGHQGSDELGIVFHDAPRAPDLHPAPLRVVDQEQERSAVLAEIAARDELPVAAVVGERNSALVLHA